MQQQTFQHNGETIAYYTAGKPTHTPIIFVHGYMSSHYVWRDTIADLQQDYYCIAIDLIGHGESEITPHSDFSISAQGKRVVALADHLNIEHFNLIGHSMGGQIVMGISAIIVPDRVQKVINVDGVMSARLGEVTNKALTMTLLRAFRPLPLLVDMFVPIYRKIIPNHPSFARIFYHTWFYDDDRFFGNDFDTWRQDRLYTFRPQMRYTWYGALDAIETYDLRPHLTKIKANVLSIYGIEDEVALPSDGKVVQDALPDSVLLMIPDCGHFPMWEALSPYLEAIRNFLAD